MNDMIKELSTVAEKHGYQLGGGGNDEDGYRFRVYPKGKGQALFYDVIPTDEGVVINGEKVSLTEAQRLGHLLLRAVSFLSARDDYRSVYETTRVWKKETDGG